MDSSLATKKATIPRYYQDDPEEEESEREEERESEDEFGLPDGAEQLVVPTAQIDRKAIFIFRTDSPLDPRCALTASAPHKKVGPYS